MRPPPAAYGIVDLKGFLAIIPKKRIPITKDAIRSALDALNAKTVITKDVLRQLLTQVGDKLTDAEFEEFVSDPALEATPDGRINVKSTSSYWCQSTVLTFEHLQTLSKFLVLRSLVSA